ncbi:MAG: DNA polymerase III subunit epsilon [Defluviimonas sp.]|uniref:DNA polymerase III subunit epsilon n=1 Tax=Albidovulum sp. TaxID=1872424 RepID=UPI002A2BA131|nr:DNA polymerase III subunit epsilon [Defluviimonas sp.]
MREIVLDTETTGFEPAEGHRIVEIGAIELVNHIPTGRTYHQYINPERAMPAEAFAVHGLGDDFLRDKPRFLDIADAFLEFIGADARLVIHNASFDMKFLNAELGWVERPPIPGDRALDTVALARRKFPGSPASLDALCRRFGIDNSAREKHGALLDSELLAEVYLELIGGRQPDLVLAPAMERTAVSDSVTAWRTAPRPTKLPPRLTDAERAAHARFVETLGEGAIWRRYS